MRAELRNLIRDFRVPSIVVTHDLRDVVSIGDIVSLMETGKVIHTGPAEEGFNARPPSRGCDALMLKGCKKSLDGLTDLYFLKRFRGNLLEMSFTCKDEIRQGIDGPGIADLAESLCGLISDVCFSKTVRAGRMINAPLSL